MAKEKQRIMVPPDNYGRVYIGLLESHLSVHAKLCYGAMWSFGQESWASLESIGRRMTVSKPTVIKAQAELEAAGWITLLENSKGRSTKSWRMNPPTVNELYHNGKADLPLTVNAVDTKKELKQEEKQEPEKSSATKAGPYLKAFGDRWKQKTGVPWTREVGAKAEIDRIRQECDLSTFEALADAYFASEDAYCSDHGWPLKGLTAWRWNQLRLSMGQGRPKAGPESPKVVL